MPKRALITGITGQDGSYLAEFLLEKGYEVYGFLRRTSTDPFLRIELLVLEKKIKLIHGCLRDRAALQRAVEESQPDEIYNLGAQSHVGLSFECPEETWEINYHGVGRLVQEAMKFNPDIKIYQASTSEMFGTTRPPQDERSPFNPISPYAEAKTRAHQDYVAGYREKHGLFICSGILFNHESPRRGKHFVTRKITYSLAKIKLGLQKYLELGNLLAWRDWGFAGDYVKAMWLMLQRDKPEDFVVATGESHLVQEFVSLAGEYIDMPIHWSGAGRTQLGYNERSEIIIRINKDFYRPNEVNHLRGDARKAEERLGWKPKINFQNLVDMMARADLELVSKENGITITKPSL